MRFNVSQLLKAPIGTTRHYTLDEDIGEIDGELSIRGSLSGPVHMLRTAEGVLVTGKLSTQVELECVRCLDRFNSPLQLEIEEEFRPSVDVLSGASLPRPDRQIDTTIDAHHVLDLSELVRQGIFLVLPMSPLCRDGCAGLCGQCGQNLNQDPGHRHEVAGDPRLEVLRELAGMG
jgi:uncharacterized protein